MHFTSGQILLAIGLTVMTVVVAIPVPVDAIGATVDAVDAEINKLLDPNLSVEDRVTAHPIPSQLPSR
ncbi:hypothetical protein C8R46DRAFT_1207515 [Mycena filopes]|nr:hypothetical protein C8R46DRAFT_1207515 [Mycena filopes]